MEEKEVVEELNDNEQAYQYAPTIKRAVNYIIDSLFVGFLAFLYVRFYDPSISITIESIDPKASLLVNCLTIIYSGVAEGFFGRTIGKLITKTYLVDVDGYKPSLLKIIIRTFSRIIPLEALTFLFPGIIGWHDLFSRTRVVEEV